MGTAQRREWVAAMFTEPQDKHITIGYAFHKKTKRHGCVIKSLKVNFQLIVKLD